MPWILESLVSTLNEDQSVNIAPQGPIMLEPWKEFLFRPFQGSNTFTNLARDKCGVMHVIDDPLLLVRAALGKIDPLPETFPAKKIAGQVIASACRYFEFKITSIDTTEERSEMHAKVVAKKSLRDFDGWNRAANALIEMAIHATRIHVTDPRIVAANFRSCALVVKKTGGPREIEAIEFLWKHLDSKGIEIE